MSNETFIPAGNTSAIFSPKRGSDSWRRWAEKTGATGRPLLLVLSLNWFDEILFENLRNLGHRVEKLPAEDRVGDNPLVAVGLQRPLAQPEEVPHLLAGEVALRIKM